MGKSNGRQSIFITGAASGMGRETARLFAGQGWFVGGFDVNEAGLSDLQAELGADNCLVRRLDVTDRNDYRAAIAAFGEATGGKMDLLYNNAGIGRGGPFAEQPFEDVIAVVQVNLMGVLIGIHEAIGLLKATPNSLCFTTSSSSATFGMANIAVYSATKHAVKGLSEALSVEFKAYGVRVADVLPGVIDTPILPPGVAEGAPKEGMFRAIPPVEVAKTVWEAYHADKLHWYVPPELVELDKAATLTPEAVRDQMAQGGLFNAASE
ncbi:MULTISPECIES: SDR family oxidoreductase [unclassified Phenylobacterium]|uniref:SDR family oxidoreductase n=1 Tax=unclassified Phenylobacterium TaxID=2640670 RepID=UPI0022B57318|nr:SDR family oxidoreductase [Phenylobacterium sp. NIBR 498073]MBS0490342.1 SDR family oxidoreductase [Pseudomonadota bacterium]WGU38689.1 SDR family oxidoreductase [Phenylobacterium sp. NIBR 498073]